MTTQKRKRGIKASRVKLDAAMLKAGYKSQAAIAEKIASNEKLQVTPKDLVNRAFRQENVSPQTISRIAHALGVDAYELYLSQIEEDTLKTISNSTNSNLNNNKSSHMLHSIKQPIKVIALVVFIILSVVLFNSLRSQIENSGLSEKPNRNIEQYKIKNLTFIIRNTSNSQLPLIQSIQKQVLLANLVKNISVKNDANDSMSINLTEKFQVDAVITLRSVQFGRHVGLQYFLFFKGKEVLFWTDNSTESELFQDIDLLSMNAISALKLIVKNFDLQSLAPSAFDSKAQIQYLKARRLLDEHQSEINIRRAEDLLNSAIAKQHLFAEAYAASCVAHIRLSWMGDENSILDDAKIACQKAQSISPSNSFVRTSSAYLLQRTGRLFDSIKKYQAILSDHPNNVTALAGLSSSALEAYRQELQEIPNSLTLAISSAEKAAKLEPDFWFHHSTLANIYFTAGNLESAIMAADKTVKLNENELALVNLGFFNLCKGSFDAARTSFKRSQIIAPDSYLGIEYLGLTYYFLGDYLKSASLRQSALDAINQEGEVAIHQMWGNLADSYRQTGQKDKSIKNYLQAIDTVDRDILQGNAAVADRIYQLYYRLQLNQLDRKTFTVEKKTDLNKQLQRYLQSDIGPSGWIKLAQIFKLVSEPKNMQLARSNAIKTCPGFGEFPDISD